MRAATLVAVALGAMLGGQPAIASKARAEADVAGSRPSAADGPGPKGQPGTTDPAPVSGGQQPGAGDTERSPAPPPEAQEPKKGDKGHKTLDESEEILRDLEFFLLLELLWDYDLFDAAQ
jgi:hypothetical protein